MEVTFIGVSNSNYGSKNQELRSQGWKKVRVTVEGRKKMRLKRAEQLMLDYVEQRGLAGVGAMTNVSALETIMKKVDEEIPLKGTVVVEMYERNKKSNAMSVNNVVPAGEVFLPETGPHAEAAAAAHANVDLMTNAQLEAYKKQEKAKFQKMFNEILGKVTTQFGQFSVRNAMTNHANAPSAAAAASIFNWKPSANAAPSSSGIGLWEKYHQNLPKLSRSKKNPVKAPQRPKPAMSMGSLFGALKGINSNRKSMKRSLNNNNTSNNKNKNNTHNSNSNGNEPSAKRYKPAGGKRTKRTKKAKSKTNTH